VLGDLLSYEEVCTEGTLPKQDGENIDEAVQRMIEKGQQRQVDQSEEASPT
jgi:hypothetical protein